MDAAVMALESSGIAICCPLIYPRADARSVENAEFGYFLAGYILLYGCVKGTTSSASG
jgi:hypothetical protein